MSIINEALKKTQTNFNNVKERTVAAVDDRIAAGTKVWQRPAKQPSPVVTPVALSTPAPAAPQTREAKQSPSSRTRWYLIVAAELLTLGLIAWTLFIIQPRLFRSFYQPKISSPAVKTPATVTPPAAPAATAPAPMPISVSTPAKNDFILKGIVMNQNKMTALINDGIYEAGDYVNGKRISKITLDRVELLDGDGIMILNVRHQGR